MENHNDSTDSSLSSRTFSGTSAENSPPVHPIEHSNSRVERRDFPSSVAKTASEAMKSKQNTNTPKALRFRMISPSNSSASGIFDNHHPVIVRPIGAPPVVVRPPVNNNDGFLKPQRKVSYSVNNEIGSSNEFGQAIVTGNPTPVEFYGNNGGSTTSSNSTYNSASSGNNVVELPIHPSNPDDTILMPTKGRTNVTAFIGADRPREGEADYFQFQFPPNKRAVGVVIPFFNEEERELSRTLESLETQAKLLWKRKNLSLHVLLIMDGWSKSADTMRDYVKFMFPAANPAMPWWTAVEDYSQDNVVETFFLQKVVPYGKKRSTKAAALGEVRITPGEEQHQIARKLFVTMIIKRDNRRKHNSHEWFFGRAGFAEFYKHEFLFATDCGTLFEDDCLVSLVSYMEHNPSTSVCTGRQRVMTRGQQGSDESLISLATLYRLAQCYDYESSFACFMGAFALFGFLPVIPGPCGLYRAADILGKARDWYFDVVNTEPDKSGMVLGNLRIAEDRVLSYAAVLKTEEPRRMALIPESTFYFEAECNLERFLLQRRRWTNGTVAGYIYMCIQNPGILFGAKMNPIRKLLVYFLLMCQLLIYLVVALAPGIFLTSLKATLGLVFPAGDDYPQNYPEYVWYACIALYVVMVITHSTTKYTAWMFYSLLMVTAAIIAGAFYGFATYVMEKGLYPDDSNYQWVTIYVVMVVTLFPLVLALLHSPKSFILMCISIVPYYLFLPMLVGWFSAYAFARTWDLTWGNRPASAEHSGKSPNTRANIEGDLKAKAMTLCIFILMGNLLYIFLYQQLNHFDYSNIIIAGFIFSFAVIQMFLSVIYFLLYYDPRRLIQGSWRLARMATRSKPKNPAHEEESEDEEEFVQNPTNGVTKNPSKSANQEKPVRTESLKQLKVSKSKDASMMIGRVPSRSGSRDSSMGNTDIRSTKSSSVVEIRDVDIQDEAEVVRSASTAYGGTVKRSPSIANNV